MKTELDLQGAFESEAATDNEPAEVPVFDRHGDPYLDAEGKPAVFFVLGEYSDALKRLEQRNRTLNLRNGGVTDAAEMDNRVLETYVTALTDWRIAIKGKAVPFSPENARTILRAAPWLGKQVDRAIAKHASFFANKS